MFLMIFPPGPTSSLSWLVLLVLQGFALFYNLAVEYLHPVLALLSGSVCPRGL